MDTRQNSNAIDFLAGYITEALDAHQWGYIGTECFCGVRFKDAPDHRARIVAGLFEQVGVVTDLETCQQCISDAQGDEAVADNTGPGTDPIFRLKPPDHNDAAHRRERMGRRPNCNQEVSDWQSDYGDGDDGFICTFVPVTFWNRSQSDDD